MPWPGQETPTFLRVLPTFRETLTMGHRPTSPSSGRSPPHAYRANGGNRTLRSEERCGHDPDPVPPPIGNVSRRHDDCVHQVTS